MNNKTISEFGFRRILGLNTTSGDQFAALPLVKPDVWFARAVVNWRARSVAKSAHNKDWKNANSLFKRRSCHRRVVGS